MIELMTHVSVPARITREQAADILGVSTQTLAKAHDKLPYFQPFRTSIMYPASMVRDYLIRSMRGGWNVAELDTLKELEAARCQVAELKEAIKELEKRIEEIEKSCTEAHND